DERARAELVGQALGGGLVDVLAADGRRAGHGQEIARLRTALDAHEGAEARTQVVELGGDRGGVRLGGLQREEKARGRGQRHHWPDVDLGGDLDDVAVLDLGHLDLRLRQDLELVLVDGLAVAGRDDVVDDLLEHGRATDPRLEELGRGLAGTEAGDVDLAGERLVGLVEVGLELRERHLDGDFDPGRVQLLDSALHGDSLLGDVWDSFSGLTLVGMTGFEPATLRSQSGCATKLRHIPVDRAACHPVSRTVNLPARNTTPPSVRQTPRPADSAGGPGGWGPGTHPVVW